jgi:hypothetical protein
MRGLVRERETSAGRPFGPSNTTIAGSFGDDWLVFAVYFFIFVSEQDAIWGWRDPLNGLQWFDSSGIQGEISI